VHAREGGASSVHPSGEGDAAAPSEAPSPAPRKLPAGAQMMVPVLGGNGSAMQAMLAKRRAQTEVSESCSSLDAPEASSGASEQKGSARDVVREESSAAALPAGA
jgi:hypothetical protein